MGNQTFWHHDIASEFGAIIPVPQASQLHLTTELTQLRQRQALLQGKETEFIEFKLATENAVQIAEPKIDAYIQAKSTLYQALQETAAEERAYHTRGQPVPQGVIVKLQEYRERFIRNAERYSSQLFSVRNAYEENRANLVKAQRQLDAIETELADLAARISEIQAQLSQYAANEIIMPMTESATDAFQPF